MSVRTRYSLIKGVNLEIAQRAIAEAGRLLPGDPPAQSKWSDWTHVVSPKSFNAVVVNDILVMTDDAWPVAREIARLVDAPHLELRVQESDHWDFTLYRQDAAIADFSTSVAYFDDNPASPRPWKMGSAEAFAKAWGIPENEILPYFVDWNSLPSSRICRTGDDYPTHDWRQIFDFMAALGADEPDGHPDKFTFSVPSWESAYVRQPAWRRAVRTISVWLKGTYPDMPKLTAAEEELWNRRRASIQLIKVDLNENIERDGTTSELP